jgi:hypothetical protein
MTLIIGLLYGEQLFVFSDKLSCASNRPDRLIVKPKIICNGHVLISMSGSTGWTYEDHTKWSIPDLIEENFRLSSDRPVDSNLNVHATNLNQISGGTFIGFAYTAWFVENEQFYTETFVEKLYLLPQLIPLNSLIFIFKETRSLLTASAMVLLVNTGVFLQIMNREFYKLPVKYLKTIKILKSSILFTS